MAFVIMDSPFNITFYPQEEHWCNDVNLGNDVGSLWSGTCVLPYRNDGLSLDVDAFKKEILSQFINSSHLQQLLKQHNNDFKFSPITIELYDEWYYDDKNKTLESINKKWVNNIVNEEYRPEPFTEFDNLYIGGAHCKTSINIWSMEGAVESGKMVTNLILTKYKMPTAYIYKHVFNRPIRLLQTIDDVLYTLGAPNVLDVILIIIIIWLILRK